jgi:hypothetical protein
MQNPGQFLTQFNKDALGCTRGSKPDRAPSASNVIQGIHLFATGAQYEDAYHGSDRERIARQNTPLKVPPPSITNEAS